ncbi:MAG: glucuronate isomerase [Planctomycetota bacterium]
MGTKAKKRAFIHEDFLLEGDAARKLYHDRAEGLGIIDFHCHLPAKEIAEDRTFANVAQAWLAGDHYKWRAMRALGVDERYVSGSASDWMKFAKWAESVPKTLGNPLYHWTHLELARIFGIRDRLLSSETAKGIWEECNAGLGRPEMSVRGILKAMRVEVVCTTDDPTDSLECHEAMAQDPTFAVRVVPTWRPDRGLALECPEAWQAWVEKLGEASDVDVRSYETFLGALAKRVSVFHDAGCRASDHGLQTPCAEECTAKEAAAVFRKARGGGRPTEAEARRFRSALLRELGLMYHEMGWVQQLHFGALRNVNSRMFEKLGPDAGYDSIGDFEIARSLATMLDRLDRGGKLPKTILYNLNPAHNALLATMIGNFQDAGVPGKMQYGSAWWFLDQKDGIEAQLSTLANMGVLSTFVGMVTDSRSFLSYPRHEYFRRVLCNFLGRQMDAGLLPGDFDLVGGIVRDICRDNAVRYFGF